MEKNSITLDDQMVIFRLGDEKFGLVINTIREIITMQKITVVPQVSNYIEGIINLRGRVIPIFNVKSKFNFPETKLENSARIVVVEIGEHTVGIIVDEVNEVLTVQESMIEEPSEVLSSKLDERYIKGILKAEEQLIILLDIEEVIGLKQKKKIS